MKEEFSLHRNRRFSGGTDQYWAVAINTMKFPFAKPTAYFILLLLSYTIGYFTATTNNKSLLHPTITQTRTKSTSLSSNPHNQFSTQCVDPIPHHLIRQTIINKIFNGTSPFNDFPPSHLVNLLKPVRLKGWGSHTPVFENLIQRIHPHTIIEVGTFLGASAVHMGKLTRQLGIQTQILCLDDFRGWAGFRVGKLGGIVPMVNGDVQILYQFMQNVVYWNLSESVIPVPFSTSSGLDRLCEWGVFGDLVEVDAGHDFHSAWSDINRAYKVVRKGGVMFGHDYFTKYDNMGVRRAVDLFAKVNGLKVGVDGQHWVISTV